MAKSSDRGKATLDRYGVRDIVRSLLGVSVFLAVLLISAGNIGWINAWVYAGLAWFFLIVTVAVLIRINPELLNVRGRGFRKNTKTFDKAFFGLFAVSLFATFVVGGLDAVRYEWSRMSLGIVAAGIVMHMSGSLLVLWAMVANPHFEVTVRIQDDRDHQVCTSGPYEIVRHPGYVALIIGTIGIPLILGSKWAILPACIGTLFIVFRTAMEDRTLQRELPGYSEYAKTTRYRLAPFLW